MLLTTTLACQAPSFFFMKYQKTVPDILWLLKNFSVSLKQNIPKR